MGLRQDSRFLLFLAGLQPGNGLEGIGKGGFELQKRHFGGVQTDDGQRLGFVINGNSSQQHRVDFVG